MLSCSDIVTRNGKSEAAEWGDMKHCCCCCSCCYPQFRGPPERRLHVAFPWATNIQDAWAPPRHGKPEDLRCIGGRKGGTGVRDRNEWWWQPRVIRTSFALHDGTVSEPYRCSWPRRSWGIPLLQQRTIQLTASSRQKETSLCWLVLFLLPLRWETAYARSIVVSEAASWTMVRKEKKKENGQRKRDKEKEWRERSTQDSPFVVVFVVAPAEGGVARLGGGEGTEPSDSFPSFCSCPPTILLCTVD